MGAEHPITIAALAGRRIDDAEASDARFPLDRVPAVKAALTKAFVHHRVTELVCSAACGADLVALAAAEELGIRRRVILPFDTAIFRRTSVIDRPGDWGTLYDRLIADARASGDLTVLDCGPGDENAYRRTNHTIIHEVASGSHRHLAMIVWEGRPRNGDDSTAEFRRLATAAGFAEVTIPTC